MAAERWREADGHPGLEVSDRGRARSDTTSELSPDNRGRVSFRHRKISLAVLVLEAFVGRKPTPKHVALRADQDPANNAIGNLSWATPSELAAARNPRGEAHPHHGKRLTARGWRRKPVA